MSAQGAARELEETHKPIADARVAAAKLLARLHEDPEIDDGDRAFALLGDILVAIDWIETDVESAIRCLPEPKRGPSPMDLEVERRRSLGLDPETGLDLARSGVSS
jgi:hypothetical protein